ncbi:MAG TPA: aldehyde dehydrogenase family protein [bacterium]|nr:aldehyde dehydrogenase family protein [bacterium]
MFRLILAGKSADSATRLAVHNPYDHSLVGEVAQAGCAEARQALEAAERARPATASLTRSDRARVLEHVAGRLEALKPELAITVAKETGKTLREARTEVDRARATFVAASEEARRLGGELVPFDAVPAGTGREGFYIRVPLGTVVAITPFNFPLNLVAHKVAPAIAAGNPFILKPASQTPLSALTLGNLVLEAGYPAEAVSVLPGRGDEIGTELVRDARPRMVTFTGSAEVGKRIGAQAGLKRLAMELGSNSAAVVTRSADLEFAAQRIVQGGYALAGQVCISAQRILVDEAVFEEVTALVVKFASALRTGDQLDDGTDMGPVISLAAAQRLEGWVAKAVQAGAEIRLGGKREGTVVKPIVLAGVPTDAEVWKEEAFGPVVCINPFKNLDQALRLVNASRYGLQAAIFTASLDEAWQAIETLDVGGVIINDMPTYRVDHMPYGGVKDSGIGREGLKYAVDEMTEIKLVCFNFWRP